MSEVHVTRRLQHSIPGRRPRYRDGTTALELVCVLPVLLAIVLGAADLGRFAQYDNIVSNAARLGAEYGATHRRTALNARAWEERVRDVVHEELAYVPDFDAGRLTLNVAMTSPDGQTQQVEVEASYPFEMIVDWPGLPGEFDVRAVVVYEVCR